MRRFIGFTNKGAGATYLDPDEVEVVEDVAPDDTENIYPGAIIQMKSGSRHWIDVPAVEAVRILGFTRAFSVTGADLLPSTAAGRPTRRSSGRAPVLVPIRHK